MAHELLGNISGFATHLAIRTFNHQAITQSFKYQSFNTKSSLEGQDFGMNTQAPT